ncbi:Uncharacterized protein dnm_075670 [Desulfonema magnum]|uniref:Uncharacterized protein n=1 Tax=Desulfonema magnum TaxID=45655 RepID=A0A975GRX4_9BACT|nr:Uncharacterized protein dnm_075670 [Desulfonema magnum]
MTELCPELQRNPAFFPGQEPYPDGKSRGSPASVLTAL